jgi:hypothetical protein
LAARRSLLQAAELEARDSRLWCKRNKPSRLRLVPPAQKLSTTKAGTRLNSPLLPVTTPKP